jgi:hypothetical protein
LSIPENEDADETQGGSLCRDWTEDTASSEDENAKSALYYRIASILISMIRCMCFGLAIARMLPDDNDQT